MKHKLIGAACGAMLAVHSFAAAAAEVQELKIPKSAGGIGFLPLLVMEQQKSIEKHPAQLGNKGLKVIYANLGGPDCGQRRAAVGRRAHGAGRAAGIPVPVGPHPRSERKIGSE